LNLIIESARQALGDRIHIILRLLFIDFFYKLSSLYISSRICTYVDSQIVFFEIRGTHASSLTATLVRIILITCISLSLSIFILLSTARSDAHTRAALALIPNAHEHLQQVGIGVVRASRPGGHVEAVIDLPGASHGVSTRVLPGEATVSVARCCDVAGEQHEVAYRSASLSFIEPNFVAGAVSETRSSLLALARHERVRGPAEAHSVGGHRDKAHDRLGGKATAAAHAQTISTEIHR
jgi:hypothetical protein